MASLKDTGHAFTFDPQAARGTIVGELPPQLAPGTVPAGSRCTILAPNRISFLHWFTEVLAMRATPLLAPSEKLLSRLRDAPPPFDMRGATLGKGMPASTTASPREFSPNEPVCVVLTSGSTGEPECFQKNARQLFGEAITWVTLLELSSESTVLATTAFHHVYGLLFGVLAPFAAGARIVALPENEPSAFHPLKIARCAKAHDVTHLITVPSHLRALLEAPIELPSLEVVVCSAAPLNPQDALAFEKKFGTRVLDVLGSTETGGIAQRRPSVSVAWMPLPGVTTKLDEAGQLVICSPFLDSPGEDRHTEERAAISPDGTFEYLGRVDSIVKVGGKRLSLKELEHFTRELPGVSACVALSRPVSLLRGHEILLVVEGRGLENSAIRKALRRHLESAFVPRRIRTVSSLPRDDRGKLKRADLLQLFEPSGTAQAPSMASASPPDTFDAIVHLSEDSPRFVGHFDGDPLYPALAQLTDIILPAIRKHYGDAALVELTRVKWTRSLRPGEHVFVSLSARENDIRFELRVDDDVACSGTARVEPKST